jgi:UDP-N-acetylmuramyl pentapeptide phosphotransferase/UDP-N-acetylglucosamine-1-phosphate transferase
MVMIVLPITAAAVYLFLPYIKGLLTNPGALRKNYRGENIPTGFGIIFIPASLLGGIILLFSGGTDSQLILLNTLGVTAMGFAGIIDDLLGSKSVKGFKGHAGRLAAGKLTTGGLKALVGGCAAAVISAVISADIIEGVLNFLLIASFANLLNLLDLRPGRAIKSFFFIWGVSYLFVRSAAYSYLLLPLAGSLIACIPTDIRGRGMMGDAGSNALGIALGLYYCLGTVIYQKTVILAVLVVLQCVSEKYSFSSIINRNKILRYVDGLGTGGLGRIDDKS